MILRIKRHRPRAELALHVLELGGAHAMLARQGPAHGEHRLEQLAGGGVRARPFAVDPRIDEKRGMDVAVTEMAEVHHRELVLRAEIAGVCDQFGDSIARDDHVLVHLADLHLGDGGAHRLAGGPEALRLTRLGRALEL